MNYEIQEEMQKEDIVKYTKARWLKWLEYALGAEDKTVIRNQ